eukprot:TRINITY_DN35752_c0_g1_i1.p1 TRINITY_DN35752_c0_g1~~TRINITY_DN35752_c0_g1_i1.p1  ORF type:complete len:398 (+),score=34.95 TRINITY_DN35752_c0_g1_i1:94-1287(+)
MLTGLALVVGAYVVTQEAAAETGGSLHRGSGSLPAWLSEALQSLNDESLRYVSGVAPSTSRAAALKAVALRRESGSGIYSFSELVTGHAVRAVQPDRPRYFRVMDEEMSMTLRWGPGRLKGAMRQKTAWKTFAGTDPARRKLPLLWNHNGQPMPVSDNCVAHMKLEGDVGSGSKLWRGVQPRSEDIDVYLLNRTLVSYYDQLFDGETLSTDLWFKVHHLAGDKELPQRELRRNLSSLLFPLDAKQMAQRFGQGDSFASALDGVLFRERGLSQMRASGHHAADLAFPWIYYFPQATVLLPMLENSVLNYGHFVSKGLGRLAAALAAINNKEMLHVLIYPMPFIIDAVHLILGRDEEASKRVVYYSPHMLYFAELSVSVHAEYSSDGSIPETVLIAFAK